MGTNSIGFSPRRPPPVPRIHAPLRLPLYHCRKSKVFGAKCLVHTCTLQVEHSLRSPVPSLKESLQPKKRRAVRQALLPSPALETNEKGGEGPKERDGEEGEERRKRRGEIEGREEGRKDVASAQRSPSFCL